MMYTGIGGGFGFFFMLLFMAGIIYFLYTMSMIAKSLEKIAKKMEKGN